MSEAPRQTSPPRLAALGGPLEGRTVELGGEELTIGRHASNRLTVREIAVSRHHAVLARDGDGVRLRDLESRHGTLVNGDPVKDHKLAHGDLIGIGGSTFLFLEHEAESLEDGPVRLDDSAFHSQSTLHLDAAEARDMLSLLPLETRRERTLGLLLRAGSELGTLRRIDNLAERLMSLALEAIPGERAALLLASAGEERFDSVFALEAGGVPAEPVTVSHTVALRVMKQKAGLTSNDVRLEEDLAGAASLRAERVRSLLCVPLLTAEPRPLGVLYLDDRRDGASFSEEDLRLATAVAGMAAPAVANLRHLDWVDGERRRLQAVLAA